MHSPLTPSTTCSRALAAGWLPSAWSSSPIPPSWAGAITARSFAVVSSLAPVGVGVGARAELDAQRRALQRQTLAEPAFQEAPVAVAHLVERAAVDDDDRRVLSPLVRIAQLGPERAVARRLLMQHGRMQHAGELGRGQLAGSGGTGLVHGLHRWFYRTFCDRWFGC